MTLISKFNKGITYLLCVIDLFSRYAWVIGLKIKKEEVLLKDLKKYLVQAENRIKYGYFITVNFITINLRVF